MYGGLIPKVLLVNHEDQGIILSAEWWYGQIFDACASVLV